MARVIKNSVSDTTATTGTGTLTLAGVVADAGTQIVSAAHATGDNVHYRIHNATQTEWEVGQGVFTSPSTLTRVTVEESSNADALVNFSAGTKSVYEVVTAADFDRLAGLTSVVSVPTLITESQSGTKFIAATAVAFTLPSAGFRTGLRYTIQTGFTPGCTLNVTIAGGINTYLQFPNHRYQTNNSSNALLFNGGIATFSGEKEISILAYEESPTERYWYVQCDNVIESPAYSHSPISQLALDAYQNISGIGGKNNEGGYVGLDVFNLVIRDATGLVDSYLSSAATTFQGWALPDKSGTVALLDDVPQAATAIVDFGSSPSDTASVVITGIAAMTASAHIRCWVQADDTTVGLGGVENNPARHDTFSLFAVITPTARVLSTGFTAVVRLLCGKARGKYKLHYSYQI